MPSREAPTYKNATLSRQTLEDILGGKKEKSKMKAVKNFGLLSFGEEAEGDEESIEKVRRSILSMSINFFSTTIPPLD